MRRAGSSHLGTFELARAPGGAIGARTAFAEQLLGRWQELRYVKFTILANHDGVNFPTTEDGSRDAVSSDWAKCDSMPHRRATVNHAPIEGVKIHSVSSELVRPGGFDRRADPSGRWQWVG